MLIVIQILAKTIALALSFAVYAMLGRAILPLFVNPMESRVYYFLYTITEPFVLPVRWVFAKFDIAQNSPFDLAFMVAYLSLMLIQMFMPVI